MQALIDRLRIFRIEADDMRALMPLEESGDTGSRLRRIFARQDFQIIVGEHHTAIAGPQRFYRFRPASTRRNAVNKA